MLKFIKFLTLLAVAKSKETCEWLGADQGQDLTCLPGWTIKGICGSGHVATCSNAIRQNRRTPKYFYMIKCCQTEYQNNKQTNCQQIGSAAGENGVCPQNQAMYGGCGSGWYTDCKLQNDGNPGSATIFYQTNQLCCDNGDINVQTSNFCGWIYGDDGQNLECPTGTVANGQCGSSDRPDCPSGGDNVYAGLYCCPYSDVKS